VDPRLQADQLSTPLEYEVLTEAVAPIHLESDPAEVAEALLAQTQKRTALAAQVAGGRRGTAAGRRGHGSGRSRAGAVDGLLVRRRPLPQQTWEQR
jgi:hypothetical protein